MSSSRSHDLEIPPTQQAIETLLTEVEGLVAKKQQIQKQIEEKQEKAETMLEALHNKLQNLRRT